MFKKLKNRFFKGTRSILTTRSSISDDGNYPEFCRQAATDPHIFSNFRSQEDAPYTHILEHVTDELGRAYLAALDPASKTSFKLNEAAKNDLVGNPRLITVGENLKISPTTLRYMKVAQDLRHYFGELRGAKICEIGVGYGGLCRIVDSEFDISTYTLVDLRPVLHLADRYLSNFPLKSQIVSMTMNDLPISEYDLVISNYAFTELSRPIQEVYFKKIMAGSKLGYFTYNEISPPEFNSMLRDEICSRTGGAINPEVPLTYPTNCIITWKRN
jgi:hypothetical protein